MLRRVDSCIAVASAMTQARGGAPKPRAVDTMTFAFWRCSSLRSATVVPAGAALRPASHGPNDVGPPGPVPPPTVNATNATLRNTSNATPIATNGNRIRSGRSIDTPITPGRTRRRASPCRCPPP